MCIRDRPGGGQDPRRLRSRRGLSRHAGGLRLPAARGTRRHRRRDEAAILAGLRRGQLLQPVPPAAGRQARDRRCHGHRLPRGRRAARGGGAQPGARDPGGSHHFRRPLHAPDRELRRRLCPRPRRAPRRRRDLRAVGPQRGAQARTQAAQAGGGSMSPAAKLTKIDKALKAKADQSAYLTDDEKTEIRICAGTACHASGRVALRKAVEKTLAERGLTDKVAVVETGCHGFCEEGAIVVVRPQGLFYPRLRPKAVEKTLAERGLTDKVAVVETGCHGFCEEGAIVVVRPQGLFYPRLKPKDIEEVIATSVVGDGIDERLLYKDPQTGEALAHEKEIAFYSLQDRIVLALNGKID